MPFDGDDAGFDPVDHCQVDPRLGTWESVRKLRDGGFTVTADITAFYRPRGGLPFTPYQHADGTRRLVWTTFMPSQVDIDVSHPAGRNYLDQVMSTLAAGGVEILRIDAVGYAVKVHAHYSQQLAIAPLTDMVYDFALSPLLMHSLITGTVDRLENWLEIRPQNAITVLDTHDGIGIIDAGPIGELPGLISHDEMAAIFEWAAENTLGRSAKASVMPAWNTLPHRSVPCPRNPSGLLRWASRRARRCRRLRGRVPLRGAIGQ